MIVWPRGVPRRRAAAVRPLRHADDRRRGADRLRPHRPDVRVRARRRHARHHLPVEGADRRLPAARRDGRHRSASTRRFSAPIGRGRSSTATRSPPIRCLRGGAGEPRPVRDTRRARAVRQLERWLRGGLEPLRSLPHVGDVRVIGGVGIVELVDRQADQGSRRLPRRHRAAADRGHSSIAACCCVRSATCSTSCRPT